MTDQLERSLRDAFHDAPLDPDSIARLSAIDYKPRQRRVPRLPAIGAVGAAGAAAIVVAVLSLSSGAAPAFAGWEATPTATAAGQLPQSCGQGLGNPAITDSRGPYTAAIYADASTEAVCLSGNGVSMDSRSTSSGVTSDTPGSVAAGQIQFNGGGTRDSAGNALTLADGRTGAGVSGVTIELSNGDSVQATVDNGWYLAWWPGTATATKAQITTASGSDTVADPAPTAPPCPTGAHCSFGYASSGVSGSAGASGKSSVTSSGTVGASG